ncbi:phage major capsid protein [Streptomyces halstedii]|uniref:phage major capsid protein n=1 Tax=Streptomyces halstedii TaxID=1944 RepID=UPI0033492F74
MNRTTGRVIGYRRNGRPIFEIAGGAPTADELREQIEQAQTRIGEIRVELERLDADAGNEDLTGEAREQWETLEAELNERQAEATARENELRDVERGDRLRESRSRWRSTQFGQRVRPFTGEDARTLPQAAARDRALAVLDSREHAEHLDDAQLSRLSRMLRAQTRNTDGSHLARRLLLTENEHYRAAFQQLVTSTSPVLTPEQARAVQAVQEWRAMSIGTPGAGGYGVPVLIDPTIILTAQGSPNDILNLARVETITTDKWKGVGSAGMSWQFRAEAAAASDNSPTLAQPEVDTHRADGYIPYSIEVGQDYPGFAAEMATLLGSGYDELLAHKLSLGTGTNEPFGIIPALAGTASEIDTATTGTITAADINGMWAALPIRYRRGSNSAAWMSHTSVNNVIQQLGSGGNDSAFTVNFTEEGVMVLKGRRAYMNDYFRTLGGAKVGLAVVGDWKNYLVAQRAGMSIELIPHVMDTSGAKSVPTGERAWFAWARVGADSINDSGFRMLSDNGA